MISTKLNKNHILFLNIVLILIVTLTPGNGKIVGSYLDKVVHFSIFLALGINICKKYKISNKLIQALLGAIIFGLITEIAQQLIPGRNMEFYDGLADTLGVATGYYLSHKFLVKNQIENAKQ